MAEQHTDPERQEGGRVVYSRMHAEGEAGASSHAPDVRPAGGLVLPGRRQIEPLLPVLVVSFVLLIGLVVWLGRSSESKVQAVSAEVQSQEQAQALKTKYLLQMRDALINLDAKAGQRQEQLQRRAQGDIVIPFTRELGAARNEAQAQLQNFEHLPVAQEAQGRAFRQACEEYLRATADPRSYSLEAYPHLRDADTLLRQFIERSQSEQEQLVTARLNLEQQAAASIRRLTFIAAALAVLIALLAAWELQRRFRQLRASLTESRRERQFNAQVLEGMMSAVAALDTHARVRSANQTFFRLFPRAVVGASVYDEIADAEGMKLLTSVTSARVERPTYHGRWPLNVDGNADAQHAAGDKHTAPRSFDVYSAPLSLDGQPGQILTLVDVTEAAATEAELRHKTALAAVGQASAQVAHEIKNPLGSIRLGVAMLRDMTQDPEAHNTITLVERGIEHLNKLTVDVTEFSRERPLTRGPADVNQLLDASLELVADKLRARQTTVERHYTDVPLSGLLDVDQLRQVFVNLIANAAEASPEGASVSLTTERITLTPDTDGEHTHTPTPAVRITVTDQGHGMDERTRARIFEPFFTTKKRGTGLGLAIAKKIVEQHGGHITVESAPDRGTSFHVELPLRSSA